MNSEQDGTQAELDGNLVEVADATNAEADNQLTGETSNDEPDSQDDSAQVEHKKPDTDKTTPEWAIKRFAKLASQRDAERAQAVLARAEAEALRKQVLAMQNGEQSDVARPRQSDEEIEARVLAKVRQESAVADFNSKCNAVAEQGKEKFPDFNKRVDILNQSLGGIPPEFLESVIEFPNAPEIIHSLGGDLDEADRILNLPIRRQAIELARLSDKLGKVKQTPISRAPNPVNPVSTGRRVESGLDDSLSHSEWLRRRNEQVYGKR